MSEWFSEFRVRNLAEHIAPRIGPKVEAAVLAAMTATIRAELPALLMDALRQDIAASTPKKINVRDRDNAIRAKFTGRNTRALALEFKLSMKQIHRIGSGSKPNR